VVNVANDVTTSLCEQLAIPEETFHKALDNLSHDIRCSCPGIIQSYNPLTQTVTVQPAIREKISINGNITWMQLPLLINVPVMFPGNSQYSITYPLIKGDECIVYFSDNCYDAFWQNGGIQNQIDLRRHDLSDGICYPTRLSQPNTLSNVSTNSLQIRNAAGTAVIEIAGSTINITNSNVNIGNNTKIDGRVFLSHTHSGIQTGPGNSGPVV
jgi:hypothetical protein